MLVRTEIGWTKTRKFFFFIGIKEPLPLKTRRSPNATLHESPRLIYIKTIKIVRRTHIIFIIKASYLKMSYWAIREPCMWDGPFDARNFSKFLFSTNFNTFTSRIVIFILFFFDSKFTGIFFFKKNTNPSKRDCGRQWFFIPYSIAIEFRL